jgi:hypothetical protein
MGTLSRHKKEQVKAEFIYKDTKSVFCPYFNKNVTFNSDGFHHLRYNGSGSEREKVSQINKFLLLPKAIEIINKSGTLQQYRKQWGAVGRKHNSDGSRPVKEMEYYAFEGILGAGNNMLRVKTIVRRVGNGEPHFWSVMSDINLRKKSSYKLASDDIIDQ